jgi:hypothetical protein
MIQEILVYSIIAAVILKIAYSLYKSLTTKEKTLCGGCGSCDIKSELKKKRKLLVNETTQQNQQFYPNAGTLRYSPKE